LSPFKNAKFRIYFFKNFRFSENYGIENQTMKSTLNIVINPILHVASTESKPFENESWLFKFQFQMDTLDQYAISSITDYFHNFHKIDLLSKIYAWAESTKEKRLFEVYRKSFEMNLTISELCQFEGKSSEKTSIKNGKQIWRRRNNLTGVHFKVAYLPSVGHLYEINNVIEVKTTSSGPKKAD